MTGKDRGKDSYSKEYHDEYMEVYKKKVRYPDVKQDIIKINEGTITITFN